MDDRTDEAIQLLKELEWAMPPTERVPTARSCPACGAPRREPGLHRQGCRLAALIRPRWSARVAAGYLWLRRSDSTGDHHGASLSDMQAPEAASFLETLNRLLAHAPADALDREGSDD